MPLRPKPAPALEEGALKGRRRVGPRGDRVCMHNVYRYRYIYIYIERERYRYIMIIIIVLL